MVRYSMRALVALVIFVLYSSTVRHALDLLWQIPFPWEAQVMRYPSSPPNELPHDTSSTTQSLLGIPSKQAKQDQAKALHLQEYLPTAPCSLTLTFGTDALREYVYNWLWHASRVGGLNYAVIVFDDVLLQRCLDWHQPHVPGRILLNDEHLATLNALRDSIKSYVRDRAGTVALRTNDTKSAF